MRIVAFYEGIPSTGTAPCPWRGRSSGGGEARESVCFLSIWWPSLVRHGLRFAIGHGGFRFKSEKYLRRPLSRGALFGTSLQFEGQTINTWSRICESWRILKAGAMSAAEWLDGEEEGPLAADVASAGQDLASGILNS